MKTFNVYCDESAHLPNDGQDVMAMGAISCPIHRTQELSDEIRQIKSHHGLQRDVEIKWTKVSPGKIDFYRDLVDFFIDNSDIRFQVLVVSDKRVIVRDGFGHFTQELYLKMYQHLLLPVVSRTGQFRVYLDIKDTRGGTLAQRLHHGLCGSVSDSGRCRIERVQTVRSEEVTLLQLADLLIGATRQAHRCGPGSSAKKAISERLTERSRIDLTRPTVENSGQLNISHWDGSEQEPKN